MLRETPNTEAVIVEYGFLDNEKDANKLKANYKDYAEAVVRAILEYKGIDYTPVTGSDYYTVKNGDTLWTIAKNNGLTVNELKSLNNLTSNTLSIGQTLKLSPGPNAVPDTNIDIGPDVYYVVKLGDSLYSIAKNNNLTVDELKRLNNLTTNTLSIGQQLLIKKGEGNIIDDNVTSYTVKSGDNLYKIANTYSVSVNDIKKANNLTGNLISIGQTLIIPTNNQLEPEYISYTVKPGDTLYKIALTNNTSVDAIKNLNNISIDILTIGQKLLIP